MSWYYANGSERIGPLADADWQAAIASGAVQPDTLVWQDGMRDWLPYRQVAAPPPPPRAPTGPPPPGMVLCGECARPFPPDRVVQIAGRPICGECKPLAVQRLKEGVVRIGDTVDPEALWQRVRERGYEVDIGSIFSRSWALMKTNYWACVGVALLGLLITTASQQIPILGIAAVFCVQPQMFAGLFWYFLKQVRGEPAVLNDAFDGFRRGFGAQAGYSGIVFGIIIAIFIPIGIVMAFTGQFSTANSDPTGFMLILYGLIFAVMIPIWLLMIRWIMTQILIIDKGLGAIAAMRLSWRAIGLHFWKIFGLLILLALVMMAGVLLCFVGVIFVAPLFFFGMVVLYEDIFSDAPARSV